jgi:cysteinyl-tRNA synthetase
MNDPIKDPKSASLKRSRVRRPASAVVAAVSLIVLAAPVYAEQSAQVGISPADIKSWGYQLQGDPRAIEPSGFDILVVDYSSDGSAKCVLSPHVVAGLKARQGAPDRKVLAYVSIGEAEDYRYYWNEAWVTRDVPLPPDRPDIPCNTPSAEWDAYRKARIGTRVRPSADAPSWLRGENPEWPGNFLVRYWDPAWQGLMIGGEQAFIDRLIAAGFDGVYLDKVDSYDDLRASRPSAERDMVTFVKSIADYARAKRPGFLIVPQNGEELLRYEDYRAAIDGIAKEGLFYTSTTTDGKPAARLNAEEDVRHSTRLLNLMRKSGKPVLVVEYVASPETVARARKRLDGLGYVPLFARRQLDEAPATVEGKAEPEAPPSPPTKAARR